MLRTGTLAFLVLLATAATVRAQPAPAGCRVWVADAQNTIGVNQNHYRLLRNVAVECNDMQFYADEAEVFTDADRVRASGNVLFVTSDNRISADRMEFNTRTRTGTFYVASGIASMESRKIDRSLFGTQEPDAYFYGNTIEKLGPKTYRITRGGFTTCVQPTPRWELVSDSATLTLEEHAVLKNTVLKVKGVPMLYLPILYYPINKEDRATGFLIPTYGASTIKGHTLSNAFFWAINRSQDATFYHDFMSKTGQQVGGEYRYVLGPGAQGSTQVKFQREHEATYDQPDGTQRTTPGGNNFTILGTMTQPLPHHFRLAANANYFSSLTAQQRNQQNLFQATNSTRRFGVNIGGNWAGTTINGTFDRTEYLNTNPTTGVEGSNLTGSSPRVIASRAEKPIGKLPLYFGATGEYVTFVRVTDPGAGPQSRSDLGLSRLDFLPTLRFPFTRWQFLTFNSSMSWRATYWTESLDPTLPPNAPVVSTVAEPIGRRYFDFSSRITGPVFTRIFNRPGGGYADKFKHVIEPTFTVQRTTETPNYNQIVKFDATDYVQGTTTITYGLNNRLYAKKESAREILSVAIGQSYYSNQNASQNDPRIQSSFNSQAAPSHLTPAVLLVHASPANGIDGTFRAEYNTKVHALVNVTTNGVLTRGWVQETAGWTHRPFVPELPGFSETSSTNFLNSATTIRKPGNALGGTYLFQYDVKNRRYMNQRYVAYYNSQCCGIAVEYQTFNFGTASPTVGVPQDRRFNLSFTLAGIGSFSNLFGAFGGQTR
jgi:LPS-assembly protein